jgi:hypothetical protein
MKKLLILFTFWIFFIPKLSYSDLYMWVDEKGVKHYSNAGPTEPQIQIQQKEEIQHDEEKAAYYESLRKEQEKQDAVERQLKQGEIKQSELAQKERREKQEAEAKEAELRNLAKKVESDSEKVKDEMEQLKRLERKMVHKESRSGCYEKKTHCKTDETVSAVPKAAYEMKGNSNRHYPIIAGHRKAELPVKPTETSTPKKETPSKHGQVNTEDKASDAK